MMSEAVANSEHSLFVFYTYDGLNKASISRRGIMILQIEMKDSKPTKIGGTFKDIADPIVLGTIELFRKKEAFTLTLENNNIKIVTADF